MDNIRSYENSNLKFYTFLKHFKLVFISDILYTYKYKLFKINPCY